MTFLIGSLSDIVVELSDLYLSSKGSDTRFNSSFFECGASVFRTLIKL